jgi:IS1 family transposase
MILHQLEAEVDEMWSFVGKKTNQQWLWIALETQTRQVLAFHVDDRSRQSIEALWETVPTVYREHATFYTDRYEVYKDIIAQAPTPRHRYASPQNESCGTLEYTLRQRVARLNSSTLDGKCYIFGEQD